MTGNLNDSELHILIQNMVEWRAAVLGPVMRANIVHLAPLNIHTFLAFLYFICLSQQFSLRGWRKPDVGECCGRLNNGHPKISSPNPYNL